MSAFSSVVQHCEMAAKNQIRKVIHNCTMNHQECTQLQVTGKTNLHGLNRLDFMFSLTGTMKDAVADQLSMMLLQTQGFSVLYVI